MKKVIGFILMFALCLGLCGCDLSNFLSLLDQEKEPVQQVVPVQPAAPAPEDDGPAMEWPEPTENEQTGTDAARMELLTGQWLLTDTVQGIPGQMAFREDKTCMLDGEEYTWDFSYTNGRNFGINILEGSTVVHELAFTAYNSREWVILLYTDNDRGEYINPGHYDVVEITPENWQEYFEIRYDLYWEEDAFGEVTQLRGCNYFFALKEEYLPRLSTAVTGGNRLTKNAVELSFAHGWQKCEVNLQEKTCTLLEGEYTVNGTDTDVDNLYHRYDVEYSMNINGFSSGIKEDAIPWLTDVEVLRADCPLYLVKDEYRPAD